MVRCAPFSSTNRFKMFCTFQSHNFSRVIILFYQNFQFLDFSTESNATKLIATVNQSWSYIRQEYTQSRAESPPPAITTFISEFSGFLMKYLIPLSS
jgi:hypothetical protein